MATIHLTERSQVLISDILNSPGMMNGDLASRVDQFWLDCRKNGSEEALDLGMRVTMGGVPLTPGLKAFAKKQAWHHSLRSVGCRLNADGSIPYIKDGHKKAVHFDDLTRNSEGEFTAYKASNGDVVFKTNASGVVTNDYTPTYRGIEHHNIYTGGVIAHYKEAPTGNFRMEVKTILSHEQGDDGVGACFGQHTYINLVKDTGEHFSVGKYGQFEPEHRRWHSYISPGGRMPGKIMCPDEYVYRRPSHHSFKDFTFQLSAAQFSRMMDRFNRECQKTDHVFSLSHNNCESWVTEVLKDEINFEVHPEVPVTTYIFGSMPNFIRTPLKSLKAYTYEVMPKLMRSGVDLALFPAYYVASVVCSLAAYVLCFINWKGCEGSDHNFLQIFDMSMTVDLPVAVRKSLNAQIPSGFLDISTAC